MLDISTEFKNEIFYDNRNFLPFLDITLIDGTALNLEKEDVWQNTMSVEDATSASNTFTIGAAITGKLKVTLNNIYDKFSEYDFADAVVIAYVGMQLSSTLEKVRIGTYIVDEPSYDGSTITLSCLDYMSKFDKPYSDSSLTYPATLGVILQDACQCCGVSLLSANFDNKNYQVAVRPTDDALTFGDIISSVAQVSCCFAKMDAYGRLCLNWYKMNIFEENDGLDDGTFSTATTPYSDGDIADGGNFKDYSSGDSVNGGTFDEQKKYHHIFSTKAFSMSTDDVVITGVRVTEEFEETGSDEAETYLAGSEGYLVDVSGNTLIQKGKAQAVATYLFGKVGGMRFRPLSVETLANPAIEAGDIAYVSDRKSNTYQIFISTRTFNLGGSESITCDAETPSRNKATQYSNMTKAVVRARKEAQRQLDAYELAMQQLTNLMTQSFGVFKTEEVLSDGSTIFYLHNKPELATSTTIWKMTADAFAVSTDGGNTWNAGMDSSGNAVVNVLSAIGINADWINAGSIAADIVKGGILQSLNYVSGKSGTKFNLNDGSLDTPNMWWDNSGKLHCSNIDLSGGIVKSSNYAYGAAGSQLNLSDGSFSSPNMWWDSKGYLHCAGADIDGTIKSSSAEITGGSFKVNTESAGTNIIGLTYQNFSSSMSPTAIEAKNSGYSAGIYVSSNTGGASVNIGQISGNISTTLTSMSNTGFFTSGTKSRIVNTETFNRRLLYCEETPTPIFSDMGEGQIDDTGKCMVFLDDIFSETIDTECQYQVFLQAYGDGRVYVSERTPSYFIVSGNTELKFGWEIKAIQKDFDTMRLEEYRERAAPEEGNVDEVCGGCRDG